MAEAHLAAGRDDLWHVLLEPLVDGHLRAGQPGGRPGPRPSRCSLLARPGDAASRHAEPDVARLVDAREVVVLVREAHVEAQVLGLLLEQRRRLVPGDDALGDAEEHLRRSGPSAVKRHAVLLRVQRQRVRRRRRQAEARQVRHETGEGCGGNHR